MTTTTKTDLDARIRDALGRDASSEEIETLLAETETETNQAIEAHTCARHVALDPATRPGEITKARKAMEDCQFTQERMEHARDRLSSALDEAREREAESERRTAYDAALAERDAVAKELRAKYPELSAQLGDLLQRLVDSNNQRDRVNEDLPAGAERIEGAEVVARGFPDFWWQHSIISLLSGADGSDLAHHRGVRLPAFETEGMRFEFPRGGSFNLSTRIQDRDGAPARDPRRA